MFSLSDRQPTRNCQGASRRDFLKVGSLALGGLSLPGLLRAQAQAATLGKMVKGRSVVFLFLQGGPSQIEFFDPKMNAPIEIRSVTGEVQTKLPGITFGGTFPQLAAMADRISIVRSFASGNADHQNYLSVAGASNPLQASMGAIYSRVAGTINLQTGLPTNITVTPEGVQPDLKLGTNFETKALPALSSPGQLGPAFAAFDPSGGGELKKNLELKLERDRFHDRKTLLTQIDSLRRQLDKTAEFEGIDTYQQQAYDIILRGVAKAFDLSQEDERTRKLYDTRHIFNQEDTQKYYDMKRSSNLLGLQMLMARRLVEAGCGYVTVADAGWDMHANKNSPLNMQGIYPLGHQVDHAVAAFLRDVEERGLSDKILLVVTGEMGRTPRINKGGGRDHFANLTPLLLAGGGLKMGQIVGQSDSTASAPITEKYTPKHLFATIMHTLFEPGEVRIAQDVPKNVSQLITDFKPIPELF